MLKKKKRKKKISISSTWNIKEKNKQYILPLQTLTNLMLLLEMLKFYQHLFFYLYTVVHTLFLFLLSHYCQRWFSQCPMCHKMKGMLPADFLNQTPLLFQLNGVWSTDHSSQTMSASFSKCLLSSPIVLSRQLHWEVLRCRFLPWLPWCAG